MSIFKKNGDLSKRAEQTIIEIYDRLFYLSSFGEESIFKLRIKFYGKYWRNKGRNLDASKYNRLSEFLFEINDDWKVGNDGKFGGKENDFIVMSKDLEDFVKVAFKGVVNRSEFLSVFTLYLKWKLNIL